MKIFELEVEDRIEELRQELEYVKEMKDSFSSDRKKYREFSENVGVRYNALESSVDSLEKSLLIDIYTFSEQLFKNFYYHLIEKDTCKNEYINCYFNKRLNAEKFSPNVNTKEIEKSIGEELIDGFKFLVSEENEKKRKYNDLVKARHTYAHKGEYVYSYGVDTFADVIDFEEYLSFELKMITKFGTQRRKMFMQELCNLRRDCKEIDGLIERYRRNQNRELKKNIVRKIREYRNACRSLLKEYQCTPLDSRILEKVKRGIENCSNFDLRKFDSCCGDIRKMSEEFEDIKKNPKHTDTKDGTD